MSKKIPPFAHPEDKRRAHDDDEPIEKAQTYYVEKLLNAGYLDHGYLTYENDCTDGEQSVATFEVESTASSLECSSIEEVEEVSHDKGGEKQGQLIGSDFALCTEREVEQVGEAMNIGMLEDVKHTYE